MLRHACGFKLANDGHDTRAIHTAEKLGDAAGHRELHWLVGSTALERRLFCDPSSSIEYDAVTNPYCSRRSDNGIYPSAWVLAEIADLLPIVSNECPKNIRILG
jgi:hypothetical protein